MGAYISDAQIGSFLLSDGGQTDYYFTTHPAPNVGAFAVDVYRVSDGARLHKVGGSSAAIALSNAQRWSAGVGAASPSAARAAELAFGGEAPGTFVW